MLKHADSFDIYGTDDQLMLDGVYVQASTAWVIEDDPDGVSTQKVLHANANTDAKLRYALDTPTDTVGIALRYWAGSIPSADNDYHWLFQWRDAINDNLLAVKVGTTGSLRVYEGPSYTFLTETAGPVVTANGWWHIEAKATMGLAGTAAIEIRVEGVEVLNYTGFSTDEATAHQVQTEVGDGAPAVWLKDYVIWDDSGTANNDFLGSVRVVNLPVTADSTLGGWLPSSGATGTPILDNNPPLDDAAYVSADDSPPAAMVYALADLPDDITSIKGVISYVRARKSDGGDGTMQVSMSSAGDLSLGNDAPITAAYLYWMDVHELDPDTLTAWTRTTLNAALLKIDRTS